MTRVICAVVVAVGGASLSGCNATKPDSLILYPDTPMLIMGAKDGSLRVSVYDPETNALIEYGDVSIDGAKGWTLTRFDWPAYIEANK